MSIVVMWDNPEQTIVRWEFAGEWVWKDFVNAERQSNLLIETVPHVVDIVADVRSSYFIPREPLWQLFRHQEYRAENRGILVIAGITPSSQAILRTLGRVFRILNDTVYTDTLENARIVVQEKREQESLAPVY